MAMEFVRAYKNFQKFEEERSATRSSKESTGRSGTGLLAPRANRGTEQAPQSSELDKVANYVQQIRKHRMKLKNGE